MMVMHTCESHRINGSGVALCPRCPGRTHIGFVYRSHTQAQTQLSPCNYIQCNTQAHGYGAKNLKILQTVSKNFEHFMGLHNAQCRNQEVLTHTI